MIRSSVHQIIVHFYPTQVYPSLNALVYAKLPFP